MFRAKLEKPELDYSTREIIARIRITAGNYREWFDQADKDKEYDLTIKRHRQKRSLDANSYFHVLVGKIAEKVGSSTAEVKNQLISWYGQVDRDDDGKAIFMIVKDGTPVEKWTELHLNQTASTKVMNGILYRTYIVMRGSHTYDTKEMSALIEGTISEAKEAGIPEAEIMSPREMEMLRNVYGIEVAR